MLSRLILFSFTYLLVFSAHGEIRVTTKTLAEVALYPEAIIPASVLSLNNSKISAQVQAVVKSIPVLVGERVKRGKILIQLDDRDYKLSLKQAKVALEGAVTRLNFAIYQLNQSTALAKEKLISDEILQQKRTNVMSLKSEKDSKVAAVDLAERDLSKCVIRAPFDAVVTERIAQVGELVNPGTPLTSVVDTVNLEVSAKLQSLDIMSLDGSSEYYFVTDGQHYQIKLRNITPVFDPIQRNKEARFIFTSTRATPGSTGVVQWRHKQAHIPAELIIKRGNRLGVFIANGEQAHFVVLENAQEGRPSHTVLPLSSILIIDGRYNVQDRDKISLSSTVK